MDDQAKPDSPEEEQKKTDDTQGKESPRQQKRPSEDPDPEPPKKRQKLFDKDQEKFLEALENTETLGWRLERISGSVSTIKSVILRMWFSSNKDKKQVEAAVGTVPGFFSCVQPAGKDDGSWYLYFDSIEACSSALKTLENDDECAACFGAKPPEIERAMKSGLPIEESKADEMLQFDLPSALLEVMEETPFAGTYRGVVEVDNAGNGHSPEPEEPPVPTKTSVEPEAKQSEPEKPPEPAESEALKEPENPDAKEPAAAAASTSPAEAAAPTADPADPPGAGAAELEKRCAELESANAELQAKLAAAEKSLQEEKKAVTALRKANKALLGKKAEKSSMQLYDKSHLLPVMWPNILSWNSEQVRAALVERKLPETAKSKETLMRHLALKQHLPTVENFVQLSVVSSSGAIWAHCAGRHLLLEKGASTDFIHFERINRLQIRAMQDGKTYLGTLQLTKSLVKVSMLLTATDDSEITVDLHFSITQTLFVPGARTLLDCVRKNQPKVNVEQWPGVSITMLKRIYWINAEQNDYMLFGCSTFESFLKKLGVTVWKGFARFGRPPKRANPILTQAEAQKLIVPTSPPGLDIPAAGGSLPPQKRLPEFPKSVLGIQMKNQIGVPEGKTRVGILYFDVTFEKGVWSEALLKEVRRTFEKVSTVTSSYVCFKEGDRARVNLPGKTNSAEYHLKEGIISGAMDKKRFPIRIEHQGKHKTLNVKPPCLELIKARHPVVKMNFRVGNSYQAQLVIKEFRKQKWKQKKISVSFASLETCKKILQVEVQASTEYQSTGMILVPKTKAGDPGDVWDESPIFRGIGAAVAFRGRIEQIVSMKVNFLVTAQGSILQRNKEDRQWEYKLETKSKESQMKEFLRGLGLEEHLSQLKDFSLSELTTLTSEPFRRDFAKLVPDGQAMTAISRKLAEERRPPSAASASHFTSQLTAFHKKQSAKRFEEDEMSMLNILRIASTVSQKEFSESLQSLGMDLSI